MMNQIKTLLRVKQLKEEQAFRTVNVKRQQVIVARQQLEAAERAIADSAAALPAKEAAIWAEIMRRVIALNDIDTIKLKIKALQDAHQRLVDAGARARHVLARAETELADAITAHKRAIKTRDKYIVLRDDVVAEFQALQDHKEEAEVEDLFSTPRRRVG